MLLQARSWCNCFCEMVLVNKSVYNFWIGCVKLSPRHGTERLRQMQNAQKPIIGSQVKGVNKKFMDIHKMLPSLRTRFPQFMHLSDVELINQLKREGKI